MKYLLFVSSAKTKVKSCASYSLNNFVCDSDNATDFDLFGVEYIPKEIRKFIWNESTKTNTCNIQANDSITCAYIYIGFIDFVIKGKSLLDYNDFLSSNEYEKNDNTEIFPVSWNY